MDLFYNNSWEKSRESSCSSSEEKQNSCYDYEYDMENYFWDCEKDRTSRSAGP